MKYTHELASLGFDKDDKNASLDCQNNFNVTLVATPTKSWIKEAKKKGNKRPTSDQPDSNIFIFSIFCFLYIFCRLFHNHSI